MECLCDHQVGVLQSGPAHRVSRAVADGELRRFPKRRGPEPLRGAASGEIIRVGHAVRPLHAEAEIRVEIRRLRHRNHIAGLGAHHPGDTPPARQLVDPSGGEDAGDVAIREVFLQMAIPGVGHAVVRDGPRENRLREDAGSVVDELRKRIGERECQPARKALFQLRLEGVVVRIAYVVAKQRDGRESREWPQQLLHRDRRPAERRRPGISPKYGFATRSSSAAPRANSAAGS